MSHEEGGNGAAAVINDSEPSSFDNSNRARNHTLVLSDEFTQKMRKALREDLGSSSSSWDDLTTATLVTTLMQEQVDDDGACEVSEITNGRMHRSNTERDALIREQRGALVGFLVSYDDGQAGDMRELRVGRWVVCRKSLGTANFTIVVDDETISESHATLRVHPNGELDVLDQFSERGTAVLRRESAVEEVLCVSATSVKHGDIVRFGQRRFHVCIVERR